MNMNIKNMENVNIDLKINYNKIILIFYKIIFIFLKKIKNLIFFFNLKIKFLLLIYYNDTLITRIAKHR